jgi:hypothetical protein
MLIPISIIITTTANEESSANMFKGTWDSIHVVEIVEKGPRSAHYKLTSTVILHVLNTKARNGDMGLSGSLTRQVPLPLRLYLYSFFCIDDEICMWIQD